METLLRTLRKKQKITLEELSSITGLSQSHLNRAELGQINISEKTAKILSDYYGVEIKPTNDVSSRISSIIQNAYKRERKITKKFEEQIDVLNKTIKSKDKEIKHLNQKLANLTAIAKGFSKRFETVLDEELNDNSEIENNQDVSSDDFLGSGEAHQKACPDTKNYN